MGEAHLDHPGEWHWFSGYGPLPVTGPCPHTDCPHNATITIAYGPDFEHYELIICDVDAGCNGRCRGWTREYPVGYAYEHKVPRVLWPDQHLGWLETEVSKSATLGMALTPPIG